MAASTKKKKLAVSKDDLRRLMKEQRSSSKSTSKKIDSPLAKYNSLGQLSCVICNSQVKNELLWNAHIQGRTHKENMGRMKAAKEAALNQPQPPPDTAKRKAEGDFTHPAKIAKTDLSSKKSSKQTQPKSILKNAPKSILKNGSKPMLTVSYGSSSSEEDEDDEEAGRTPAPPPAAPGDVSEAGLPADFFDSGVKPSASSATPMAEKLPEGFFDDPKKDAKVRQVEYKDKMEEEWELFQRTMKEENTVSEAILEEDEELATEERNITEIDDQIHRWSQVDQLHQKKEAIMSQEKKDQRTSGSDSEVDEQDFEEFLDWRTKKAWK